MATPERVTKQNYLRDTIILANYNPSEFEEYLSAQKEDGTNIDNWYIEELHEAVQRFKQSARPLTEQSLQQSISKPDSNEQSQISQDNLNLSVSKRKSIWEEIEPKDQQQQMIVPNYAEEVKIEQQQEAKTPHHQGETEFNLQCQIKKTKTSVPIENNIQIKVSNPEQKSGGILNFGSSYIEYTITTLPYKWIVQRRYSDVKWLEGVLKKLYPAHFIPPIIKIKRKDIKQAAFLDDMVKQQDLFYNEFTQQFLKQKDHKMFQKIQKEGEKYKVPQIVSDFQSVSGQANCKINSNNKMHFVQMCQFVQKASPIYLKQNVQIKQQSKQLTLDCDSLSNTIYGIGQNFDELFKLSNEMNSKIIQGKVQ